MGCREPALGALSRETDRGQARCQQAWRIFLTPYIKCLLIGGSSYGGRFGPPYETRPSGEPAARVPGEAVAADRGERGEQAAADRPPPPGGRPGEPAHGAVRRGLGGGGRRGQRPGRAARIRRRGQRSLTARLVRLAVTLAGGDRQVRAHGPVDH